ncbi:glycosyltransferase family 39 protein [Streptomyces sp. ODS28]|uniref:glycosyltransferase family 39 protein n=1 Tax=Streptomyces sp. ODS28 TaxID=3136688 RepID=UPI0031E9A92E
MPSPSAPSSSAYAASRPSPSRGGGRGVVSGGRAGYWPRLLPVLAALAVLTRLPSFARPVWNPDEGFLATQARMLAGGGRLYDTVVDRKPPLVPWLYQGAFALFGDGSLWPLRVAAVLAVLAGAALAASLARRRWGERAGAVAGVLYVLASVGLNPEDTQAATFEVFMLPWTVAAVWCADRGRWLFAGLSVAGAMLCKQTGGAVLLPVLFLLWRDRAGWWALLRALVGAAAPVVACAVAFGPGRFVYWLATGSGAYASVAGAGMRALTRGLGSTGILLLACAPFVLALLYAGVARREGALRGTADLWVWLGSSVLGVLVGFQFYGHYFLQLVPPLALLGAAALCALRPRTAVVAVAATGVLCAGYVGWGYVAERAELDHARRVAAAVRSHASPPESVLLWGMHPEGYWFADRAPASRYLTAGFLTNFSGGRGGVRVGEQYAMDGAWAHFRGELARERPAVIVDDARGAEYGVPRTPTLRAYVARHYVRAGTVDGAVLYVPRR